MLKLISTYRVTVKKGSKSIVITCDLMKSTLKRNEYLIEFSVEKNILALFGKKSLSRFVDRLSKNKAARIKIDIAEGLIRRFILNYLKNEFGKGFSLSSKKVDDDRIEVHKKTLKVSSLKKAASKKKAIPKKRMATKRKMAAKKTGGTSGIRPSKKLPAKRKSGNDLKAIGNYANFIDNINETVALDNVESVSVENYNSVEVFFATDRARSGSEVYNEFYGKEKNARNRLEYGRCLVSVPFEHKVGDIERPKWWRNIFSSVAENPEKHIMIYGFFPESDVSFFNSLSNILTATTDKDSLLFIHGYNVDFDEAIRRTAQLKYDLSFNGPAITYSWPSNGKTKDYAADLDSVQWTVPHLKDFLKKNLNNPTLKKLNVIVHSMGNVAFTQALSDLKEEGYLGLSKIHQIILAAPDIDITLFKDVIAPGITGIARITLYASSNDIAMNTSQAIRAGRQRVGDTEPEIVIVNGVDSIDASNVAAGFFAHSYFGDTRELLNDIYHLVRHGHGPQERNLKENLNSNGSYWVFVK